MDHYKKSLVSKLKFKCKEANEELSEVQSIYNIAVSEFCIALNKFCIESKIKNPLDSIDKDKKEKKPPISSGFKSVFFDIAKSTHPDKCRNEDGRDTFNKAVEAKKENKLGSLISIAKDLKIDISDLDYSSIREIEESIVKMKDESERIRSSYPWLWFYSESTKKDYILKKFCQDTLV